MSRANPASGEVSPGAEPRGPITGQQAHDEAEDEPEDQAEPEHDAGPGVSEQGEPSIVAHNDLNDPFRAYWPPPRRCCACCSVSGVVPVAVLPPVQPASGSSEAFLASAPMKSSIRESLTS